MTCDLIRDWLLNADNPADLANAPCDVAEHVTGCAGCLHLQQDLLNLEQRWRGLPLPAQAEKSKTSFLVQLQNPPTQSRLAAKPRRWRTLVRWGAVASLFLLLGGVLFFWPTPQVVEAHPDVLDDLIEWNLQMTEAPTPAERKALYRERNETLRKALRLAKLNQQEHELGESLLDNGAWMADNEDPIEELSRYHLVADRLLERVHLSSADANQSDRFAKQFRKINERGIDAAIERIKPEKFTDPEHHVKFNKLMREDVERAERVKKLIEKAPDLTRKELKKAMDLTMKRPKPKKAI